LKGTATELLAVKGVLGSPSPPDGAYDESALRAPRYDDQRLARADARSDDRALAPNTADDFVDLASSARRTHALDGHRWPGAPGKSPFPRGWTDDRIMHHASDIATDPNLRWIQQTGKPGAAFTMLAIRSATTWTVSAAE